jgi:hypothetical protein
LRMPQHGYQALQSRAETFVTTVTPIKTTFVERGLPPDFDEQLRAAVDAFIAASQRQSSGRTQRVQGTAGLDIAGRAGRKIVREIDSILFATYDDHPDLYAAWKSASRVEHVPTGSTTAAPITPLSAPAPAPNRVIQQEELQPKNGGLGAAPVLLSTSSSFPRDWNFAQLVSAEAAHVHSVP